MFSRFFQKRPVCAICLSRIARSDLVLTPCMHSFDKACLVRWMNERPTCPVCRRTIKCYRWAGAM